MNPRREVQHHPLAHLLQRLLRLLAGVRGRVVQLELSSASHGAEVNLSDARTTGPELELSAACATGSSCQRLLADSRGELAQP